MNTATFSYLHKLEALIRAVNKHNFQGCLIAIDPGETTGITCVTRYLSSKVELIQQNQLACWPFDMAVEAFKDLIHPPTIHKPTYVVYESYRVYKWRLQEHSFSEIPTIQIIGCLKTWCHHFSVPYSSQTAQQGKGFFTDDKLKELDLYFPGQPHARDSLRHAAHFLTFGPTHNRSNLNLT
jgi:hypothetical protein